MWHTFNTCWHGPMHKKVGWKYKGNISYMFLHKSPSFCHSPYFLQWHECIELCGLCMLKPNTHTVPHGTCILEHCNAEMWAAFQKMIHIHWQMGLSTFATHSKRMIGSKDWSDTPKCWNLEKSFSSKHVVNFFVKILFIFQKKKKVLYTNKHIAHYKEGVQNL